MELQSSIEVKYKSTADYQTALEWLLEINDTKEIIACDFEAAIKYTPEQIETLQTVVASDSADVFKKIAAKATLEATPLDHPSHVKVTHFNLAWSESEAIVIIMDSEEVTDLVFDFIINTDIKQVWHRAAYDFCLIYYNTGQFPKNFEDSQVFAKTVFNHVDVFKARTGLKELAGAAYGRWGMVTESDDFFVLANMYDPLMIEYAATDACATMFVWNRLVENFHEEGVTYPDTTEHYSPWDQLPAPNPKDTEYPEAHFYHYTGKWLVKDTVRIMMNGLPTDLVRVKELEAELEQILDKVKSDISQNETAKLFIKMMNDHQIMQYKEAQKGKMRSASYYLKPFSTKNAVHRCFFMDVFAEKVGLSKPTEKLEQGCSKWSVKTIKAFTDKFAPLSALVNHTLSPNNPTAVTAMKRLAEVQAENYNKKYKDQIENPDIPEFEFNPNSDAHKLAFFEWAGITSDKFSKKTGLASWDRDQIEQVNKTTSDPDIKAFTQSLIDHSFAAIVKNNFVKAFYRYSVEGRLYGKYSLFGAKSGRFTSSNPKYNWALQERSCTERILNRGTPIVGCLDLGYNT